MVVVSKGFKKYFFVFLIFFLFYLYYLFPSLTLYADNAELLAVVGVDGVAHPPGYPLYAIIGRVIKSLPGENLTWKLNAFSAFCGALSLTVLYRISLTLSNSWLISLWVVCLLAFSKLFWFSSLFAEKMALAVLLIAFLFWTFFSSMKIKHFYWSCFILGLGFSHHHTIVFLLPSFIIIWGNQFLRQKWSLKNLLMGAALFLSGFLPYLYLLYAAQKFPPINWGRPVDLKSLADVFLRKMYGTFEFSATGEEQGVGLALDLTLFYFKNFFHSFGFSAFLIPMGFWACWKQNRKWALCVGIGWFLIGPLFTALTKIAVHRGVYAQAVVERHMVYSHWIAALFFLFSAKTIVTRFRKKSYVFYSFLIISLLMTHVPKNTPREGEMADRFLDDVFQKMPSQALVIAGGDTYLFGGWYYQFVKKQRKDITLLSLSLSGDLLHLHKQNPHLWPKPAGPLNQVIYRIISDNLGKRRIFTLGLTADQMMSIGLYNNPFVLKPFGHALEIIDYIPSKEEAMKDAAPWNTTAVSLRKDSSIIEKCVAEWHATAHFNHAVSLRDMGYGDLALEALNKARAVKSPFLQTQSLLDQLLNQKPQDFVAELGVRSLRSGYFSSARQLFLRSLTMDPKHILALHGLAESYVSNREYGKALKAYRRILAFYPADPIAVENIKRIQAAK